MLPPRERLLQLAYELIHTYGTPPVPEYLAQHDHNSGYIRWRDDQASSGMKGWSNGGSLVIQLNSAALALGSDKFLEQLLQATDQKKQRLLRRLLLDLVDTLYHELVHCAHGERFWADEKRAFAEEIAFLERLQQHPHFASCEHSQKILRGLIGDARRDARERYGLAGF